MTNLHTIRKFGKFNFVLFGQCGTRRLLQNTIQPIFYDISFYLDDTNEVDFDYMYNYGDAFDLDFSTFDAESDVFIARTQKNDQFIFTKTGLYWNISKFYRVNQITTLIKCVEYDGSEIIALYRNIITFTNVVLKYTIDGTLIDILVYKEIHHVLQ